MTETRGGMVAALAGRAGWNMVDQLLSSLSNFVLSVLVARALTTSGYGAFALSFSLYAYALTLSRLLSQPLMIRYSGAAKEGFAAGAGQAGGAALVLGGLAGGAMLVVGLLLRGTVGWSIATVGVLLPGLLLQDCYRVAFFASGRPAAAAASDALWGVAQLAGVGAIIALGLGGPEAYLLAWGLAGWLGAAWAAVASGFRPAPGQAMHWVRTHADLTRYSVTEVVVISGANQLTLVLLAAIGGLAVVGTLRGAQVLTAPATILTLSAMAFAVPELARRPALSGPRLVRAGLAISAVVVGLLSVWGALLLLLPDGIGRMILGETWGPTRAILVPSVIAMLVGIASLGPSAGVYAKGAVRVLFPLVVLGGPVYLVAGVLGVVVGGTYGAAVGLAVAALYGSVISWTRFVMISRWPPAPTAGGGAAVQGEAG